MQLQLQQSGEFWVWNRDDRPQVEEVITLFS